MLFPTKQNNLLLIFFPPHIMCNSVISPIFFLAMQMFYIAYHLMYFSLLFLCFVNFRPAVKQNLFSKKSISYFFFSKNPSANSTSHVLCPPNNPKISRKKIAIASFSFVYLKQEQQY